MWMGGGNVYNVVCKELCFVVAKIRNINKIELIIIIISEFLH